MKSRILLMAVASIMMLQVIGQEGGSHHMSLSDASGMMDIISIEMGLWNSRMAKVQSDIIERSGTSSMISKTDKTSGFNFNGTSWNHMSLVHSAN